MKEGLSNILVNLLWAAVSNMLVQFIKCVRCGSCVKIFSHWPTTVLNTVVFGDLLQLGKNQVIYEYLKVDFSLPYSLCVFGDWQEKVT
jgi:predicted PP-loop superfamily ATPase